MNHREMTKHIRGRIKAAKIPARVRLYTACGRNCIQVDRVTHDGVWTGSQAREINLIADVNGLTHAQGSKIDLSEGYWSRVPEWRGCFTFEFHG